jgi:cytochrome c oxidase subunit II
MPSVGKTCRRLAAAAAVAAAVLTLSACGGDQNTLEAAGHPEHEITRLFWVMFAVSIVGFGVIATLLFLGWWRRNEAALPGGGGERAATRVVVIAGVVVPIVLLTALFLWSDLFVMRSTAAPAESSTALTIDVVGHQWWWEARYRGSEAVTANEIHIPLHTRVDVVATTADVIHSFWVPELNRKVDMIPGVTNRVLLEAERPGVYRGQCSEFCGVQHAHMAVLVVAQPKAEFDRWLAHEAQPAQSSSSRGAQLFLSNACADCHEIRGTDAHGTVGPDLTHVASRMTLASGVLENTPANLSKWLRDPQHVKEGNRMPNLNFDDRDWQALEAYMESLR